MRNDDVEDLIAQLTRLQVQQSELFVRLERATNSSTSSEQRTTREPTTIAIDASVTEEPTTFAIGDRVKIRNPNPFQTDKGEITKIGKKRITVTTASGQKILRAAKNITAL